jgi:hypothetical protein
MILSPASRALIIEGNVIPGLRSLRSLTRGYHLSSLRDSLPQTSKLTLCCVEVAASATQQIVGRESRCIGMFRIMTGPAMLE